MKNIDRERKKITASRRLVLKIGSGVLTRDYGLDMRLINRLAEDISHCKGEGREIIIVSSGAIASGFKKVGLGEKPLTIQQKQACAAVGQASLILAYERSLGRYLSLIHI